MSDEAVRTWSPENIRPMACEFETTVWACRRLDYEEVEMHDGGVIRLCPRHRGWAAALGRA